MSQYVITRDDTFDHEFDLTERDLNEIIIKETNNEDNCYIWDRDDDSKAYKAFVLKKNKQSKILCEITFYKSSKTDKYVPRPTFKRVSLQGDIRKTKSKDNVSIRLSDSADAYRFWDLISFLSSYKDFVDVGQFENQFNIIPKDSYIAEFKTKTEKQQVEELKEFIKAGDLTSSDIKSLTFESRKNDLKAFFLLLKNKYIRSKSAHTWYREKYNINSGEEYIWHHFLKKNDWILGLNLDLRFIIELLDEQKVGIESSKGKGSPQSDFLGITDFTTLVELKHPNTDIFKKTKSKGRANTWDFTTDFVEGISQCLGQKFELDKFFDTKIFVNEEGTRLNKQNIQSIDPHSILLIGNKKREFPVKDSDDINLIKNKTLERFRRNNRNIDVLTFDELFERAYQIVYSQKSPPNWYEMDELVFFD